MHHLKTIEGQLSAENLSFTLVACRFNDIIVDRLIGGAVDFLLRHGADREKITIVRIPGAFELPVVCQKVAQKGSCDGIVALGAVIRGDTPHFEYVAGEATKGIAQVALQTGIPIGFGLITTENIEQAIARAGSKAGNKGADAAATVLETIRVMQQL